MENRNNAQINPAGYFAKANVKINLLSTKIKVWYKIMTKKGSYESQSSEASDSNVQTSE